MLQGVGVRVNCKQLFSCTHPLKHLPLNLSYDGTDFPVHMYFPFQKLAPHSPDLADDEGPEWEALLAGLEAAHGVVDDEHLVDVEGDAQDVAQEEHAHQTHEHHRKVVLLPTPRLNE